MKLTIPVQVDDKLYTDVELQQPKAGAMADARGVLGDNPPRGIAIFLQGAITALHGDGTLDEPKDIRRAIDAMAWVAGLHLAVEAIVLTQDDDSFSGAYPCPVCHQRLVCNAAHENEDRVSDLRRSYMDGYEKIDLELDDPVTLEARRAQEVESIAVTSLTMHHPTMADQVRVNGKHGQRRAQEFATMLEALEAVGTDKGAVETDRRWKQAWGDQLFRSMSLRDALALGRRTTEYGLITQLDKTCPECGSDFEAEVDVSNFFASALR